MLNFLIIVIMLGILISLASGLFFLVRDKGKTKRTITSLSLRVALSVVLLTLLAYGFITRFIVPGS